MRILINGWAISNRGGIGRYTRNLARAFNLLNNSHELLLVASEHCLNLNYNTSIINPNRTNRILYESFLLPSICRKFKPDVVFAPDFVTCNYSKAKRITVIHDLSPIILPQSVSLKARMLFSYGIRNTIKHADLILADSLYTKLSIEQHFEVDRLKVNVLYPALEPMYLDRSKTIPFKDRKNILMWVGDAGIRKDIGTLIQAASLFIQKHPEFRLLCIGPIKDEYKSLPWLDHKQNISDNELINCYRNSKCLVNTSILEGFGYPVAEALSQGTPCVVTNTSSMLEISSIGICGFKPGDFKNCAQLISETINDANLNPETIANQIIEQPFNYQSTVNKLLEAIKQI